MYLFFSVTNNWEGIYSDFPVRALCTMVRNVDRVTVLYTSSLQTDAIFQKVSHTSIQVFVTCYKYNKSTLFSKHAEMANHD